MRARYRRARAYHQRPVGQARKSEVILLGGGSSVGKTTLARELCRRLSAQLVEVDDVRRVVDDSRVQFFARTRSPWQLEPEALRHVLKAAAEAMRPVLAEVVHAALGEGRRLVLEGEALDPGLAARFRVDVRVRALFVVETDQARLAKTLWVRSPAFRRLSAPERDTVAQTDARYCSWLMDDCCRRGLPYLESQPWVTLADRAERVLVAQHRRPDSAAP